MFDWNEERVEQLRVLWDKGHTASQIADELGGAISRSAVLGKVRRLKLPMRVVEARPKSRKTQTLSNRIKRNKPFVRFALECPPPVEIDGARITTMSLAQGQCKYPYGDPKDEGFHYCGNKADGVYCEYHTAITIISSAKYKPLAA